MLIKNKKINVRNNFYNRLIISSFEKLHKNFKNFAVLLYIVLYCTLNFNV